MTRPRLVPEPAAKVRASLGGITIAEAGASRFVALTAGQLLALAAAALAAGLERARYEGLR